MPATVGYAAIDPDAERPPRTAREAVTLLRGLTLDLAHLKLLQVLVWAAGEWQRSAPGTGDPPDLFSRLTLALVLMDHAVLEEVYGDLAQLELDTIRRAAADPTARRRLALSRIGRYLSHSVVAIDRLTTGAPPAVREQLWADVMAGMQAAEELGGIVFLTRWWYDTPEVS